jgi:hypothetical protein
VAEKELEEEEGRRRKKVLVVGRHTTTHMPRLVCGVSSRIN